MKLQLYPEDILLEYAEKAFANGCDAAVVKQSPYLKHLPRAIEFSQDFAERWQTLVKSTVKRFVADTFRLRSFIFEIEGYTKRFNCADEQFWNSCDFSFSQRGAERLYELLMREFIEEEPMFLVATPDDGLMLSICTSNFGRYSFPWLCRNRASWLTQALFVAWQQVAIDRVPWQYLLENPAEVALPLREYLIERCADLVVACSAHLRRINPAIGAQPVDLINDLREDGVPLKVAFYTQNFDATVAAVRKFVAAAEKAFANWAGAGSIGLDDEKFIRGALQQYRFAEEVREFEQLVGDYLEGRGMEEAIYESIIQNQNSDRSST
ncbi:MAG: hypothetical protein CVV42_08770 [Candidatus Riflebacteria bacterium HGW-Riflebacteria-2]|nr:MAG: hypothetical protein CVV42_08770 [Candidatus Riflebacteria bacterium HGW-Riflebacteria-2]